MVESSSSTSGLLTYMKSESDTDSFFPAGAAIFLLNFSLSVGAMPLACPLHTLAGPNACPAASSRQSFGRTSSLRFSSCSPLLMFHRWLPDPLFLSCNNPETSSRLLHDVITLLFEFVPPSVIDNIRSYANEWDDGVIVWSGSTTHPSNCTRLWFSKYPHGTRKKSSRAN